MIDARRQFLSLLASVPLWGLCPRRAQAETALAETLADLEARCGGRLGVHVIDVERGLAVGHRSEERFGLCSTFKLPLAAVVLQQIDAGRLDGDEWIAYGEQDLVPHAPVTGAHLAEGRMRLIDLAEAAQVTSDNVAANLLLRRLGGPTAVTALIRSWGDVHTRLDRMEPEMNYVPSGELRDTTTPAAMAATALRLFNSELLSASAQARLRGWMIATETGARRLRAGFPADWVAGDKTGTGYRSGMPNKHNDVAIVWRAQRPWLAVAAYYDAPGEFPAARAEDDAVLAEVGQLVAAWSASA